MKGKKKSKSIKSDDNQPATKGDVRAAVDEVAQATNSAITTELKPIRSDIAELKEDVFTLKEDVTELKAGQARLERSLEAMFEVIKSIDQQLREHKTHPDRLSRLERSVFRR